MGRRKISFEPAASILGCAGFNVMKVSLCGPHSFETSTLPLKFREALGPPPLVGPLFAMYSYLSHQVGLCVLLSANAPICTTMTNWVDNKIRKNGARIFVAIHPKTFWLILSKGLQLLRTKSKTER